MSIFRRIKKALGWEFRSAKPEYDLNPVIYAQLKPFRVPLVLVQVVMMIGTLGYILIDDFPILDAIYQTGITFTTVGFGEVAPISPAGRFFTITLIIFGFALFTLSTAILIDAVIKGRLFELYKERNMLYKIARLRKHFVLFYHNEYTAQLARQFNQNHVPFVVVDPSEDIEQIAKECNYPYFVREEPFKETSFLKSHLSSAKGAITLSKNISNNITLIASVRLYEKELGRNPFLIIANAESQNEKLRLKKLGADKVVATPSLMAKRVSAMAIRPDMENVLEEFLYKPDTPIDMQEALISEESWAVNKELKELKLRDRFKVSVIGITEKRGRFIQMPKGNAVITPGCKLLLVGNQRGLRRARRTVLLKNKPKDF
ncbi:potassium channel family protein [Halarcobacter anaerophilus]|jgi:voltage-gated potassium channel|uniref:Potassium channel protein n=1 Tax=Halarcobacter anaerophilus TaxID=877500 RepID=A0A4V1LQH7_9BACT|nr:potassium channel protein [Halarcobacter anaerophilus]QDF29499.1 putative potassium channel protein (TrkA domain) [Halarcobacter anaerophilus]RXJ64738.1 potassium channel protein [Halarcobacter anaerophilus]